VVFLHIFQELLQKFGQFYKIGNENLHNILSEVQQNEIRKFYIRTVLIIIRD
jgi:hypothetical protein